MCFFLATHLNPKMTFCIYEEWFRPNPLSYRALCCPFFFWYQHSRRQMSTLKGALWRISRQNFCYLSVFEIIPIFWFNAPFYCFEQVITSNNGVSTLCFRKSRSLLKITIKYLNMTIIIFNIDLPFYLNELNNDLLLLFASHKKFFTTI